VRYSSPCDDLCLDALNVARSRSTYVYFHCESKGSRLLVSELYAQERYISTELNEWPESLAKVGIPKSREQKKREQAMEASMCRSRYVQVLERV